MPRDTSNFPPRVTHYTDDPTRYPWPDPQCHSHVLGWDPFTDVWALVSCARCLEHRPAPNNVSESADMTNCEPIADLYTCWHCQEHAVEIKVGAEPPEYHDVCGYGPLQWSGQLFDRIHGARTYELRAARVEPEHRSDWTEKSDRRRPTMMTVREQIELDQIDDNPWQPRQEIEPEALQDLAESIHRLGVMQAPLGRVKTTIGADGLGRIQLAFGHRRVAACRLLHQQGLWPDYIEMNLTELSDDEMAIIALTENEVRKQLSQIEVVRAYRRAIDETGLEVQELAERIGVDRSTLSNNLRVLELPDFVLEHVESGAMSIRTAREFLVLQNADHCHADDMAAVISAITNTYRVVHEGAPANWGRKNVMQQISERVASNEQDFRPLGRREAGMPGLNGAAREATFDIEAFSRERRDTLHTIPAGDKSRVWTCDVKEWRRRQTQASREANKQAEVTGTSRSSAGNKAPSSDKQFDQALAKDPVWKRIAAQREKKGPGRPVTDEERTALGTRAELKTMDTYGNEFWKVLENARPEDVYDWERDRAGGRVPPFFQLADCRSCVAGAAYAKRRYDHTGDGVKLVCTNRSCYDRKLSIDTPAHRKKVEAELVATNLRDGEMVRISMGRLAVLSRKDLRTLAASLIAAQPELDLTHFMGVPHQKWSYKPVTVQYVTGMLAHKPARFDWGRDSSGKVTLDIASLDDVPDDDLLELTATLMTYHLRHAGRLDTVSPGNAEPAPSDALEVRELLTGEPAAAEARS